MVKTSSQSMIVQEAVIFLAQRYGNIGYLYMLYVSFRATCYSKNLLRRFRKSYARLNVYLCSVLCPFLVVERHDVS